MGEQQEEQAGLVRVRCLECGATYDKPLQWATGAKLVLVNGQVAVENEKPTDKLAGRAIRHPVK